MLDLDESWYMWYIALIRFLLGILTAPAFGLSMLILKNWAPLSEMFLFYAIWAFGFQVLFYVLVKLNKQINMHELNNYIT